MSTTDINAETPSNFDNHLADAEMVLNDIVDTEGYDGATSTNRAYIQEALHILSLVRDSRGALDSR